MVRHSRPIRGGKQRPEKKNFRHGMQKPKPRFKQKFDIRTTSYVQERNFKNEQVERRRKLLEEQKAKKEKFKKKEVSEEEDEEDDVEVNPLGQLLSTFKDAQKVALAVESEDESDEESEDENSSMDELETQSDDDDNNEGHKGEKPKKKMQDKTCETEETEIEIQEENEEDAETAKEDAGVLEDPFSIHLRNDLSIEMHDVVSNNPVNFEVTKLNWPLLGNLSYMIPMPKTDNGPSAKRPKVSIMDNKQCAKPGQVVKPINKIDWEKLHVKSQIHGNLNASPMTEFQKELFSIVNNYQDLLYMERTFSNADEIRFIYCLHAINHALKTRTKVLHHNEKLKKMKKGAHAVPDEFQDQGLVRPKVLILVPFKHSCLQIVNLLISILIGEDKGGSVVNKNRFMEDFSGNELTLPRKKPKPEDYEETFKGNIDDKFLIGISITKKTLKLYADFYSSDIIIASPLGLRMLIGVEGELDRDYDFLSSIELLILDQADLFVMQNWDHLIHVFNHLHLQPKKSHDADFSRVRSWCVNGWTKYYRQTLVFSALQLPEILSVFNKYCYNYAGKVKVGNPVTSGSVSQAITQLPLVFERITAKSPMALIDARFQYFVKKILPHYRDSIMNHTLIFVPSYYDFVPLRNYMKEEELSFAQICEYTEDGKVARARDMFFHSDRHFLLYSERAHFFHRRQIKGIRHLIFYAPPVNPHFFSEMCNLMQESYQNPKAGSASTMTVTTIYSQYDLLQLAAIVGTEKATKMLSLEKNVHMIMTR